MSDLIDISNLDKAEILAALYNRAEPRGLGSDLMPQEPMSKDRAEMILQKSMGDIDYIDGRAIKVNFASTTLDPRVYDELNGSGLAAEVVHNIKLGEEDAET